MLFSHCQAFSSEKNVMGILEMHICFKLQDGQQVQISPFLKISYLCVLHTCSTQKPILMYILLFVESGSGPSIC